MTSHIHHVINHYVITSRICHIIKHYVIISHILHIINHYVITSLIHYIIKHQHYAITKSWTTIMLTIQSYIDFAKRASHIVI